jgi:hypothetical protein
MYSLASRRRYLRLPRFTRAKAELASSADNATGPERLLTIRHKMAILLIFGALVRYAFPASRLLQAPNTRENATFIFSLWANRREPRER